jgi:hypothetical protein
MFDLRWQSGNRRRAYVVASGDVGKRLALVSALDRPALLVIGEFDRLIWVETGHSHRISPQAQWGSAIAGCSGANLIKINARLPGRYPRLPCAPRGRLEEDGSCA